MMDRTQAQALLEHRASLLARPIALATPQRTGTSFLVFAVHGRRYALNARFVREVARTQDVLRVPGGLSHLLGVTTFRGEYVPVIDVACYLGVHSHGLPSGELLVMCGESQREFALIADEVEALRDVDVDQVIWSAESAHGLAQDGTQILDGCALFEHLKLY